MRNCSLDKTIYKIFFYGITGCILVSSAVALLNLFIPISFSISVGLLVIGLIGALFWFVHEGYEKYIYVLSFALISLVTYIAVLFFGVRNFDTQFYHLNMIDWIVSNPLPFGIANLHVRLGFNSAWFSLGAVVEQPLFLFNYPIFLINAIILTLYGMLLVSIIHSTYTRINEKISLTQIIKNVNISQWFFILSILPVSYFFTLYLITPSPANTIFLLVYGMLLISIIYTTYTQIKGKETLTQIITTLPCSEWFFILSILPIPIFSVRNLGSPSPDYPVFLLTFVIFGIIINYIESRSREKKNLLWLALICAFFTAGIKLSAIMLAPLVLLFIGIVGLHETPMHGLNASVYMFIRKIPLWCYILSFFAIIPTWIQGFITAGSPIFPKTLPLIHDIIPWSVPHEIAKSTSEVVLIWGRSHGTGYPQSLHGYDWVSNWVTTFMWQNEILTLLLIFSIAISICLIYYAIREQKRKKIGTTSPDLAWYPFFMVGVGLFFWFFTGPDPRFAAGYLFSLALFIIIFPYLKYGPLILEQIIIWSKIGITLLIITMAIGVTVFQTGPYIFIRVQDESYFVAISPFADNFPKSIQTLTYPYTEHTTIGGDIIHLPEFAEVWSGFRMSRFPLLTAYEFYPNLTITTDPITGYYRMFQIREV